MAAPSRNRRRRGTRVKNNHLSWADHAQCSGGNAHFFLPMQALLFTQSLILKRPGAKGQRSSVSAFEHSLVMQVFEILAYSNERYAKALGQIADEDSAVFAQQFENFPAAFLAEHRDISD